MDSALDPKDAVIGRLWYTVLNMTLVVEGFTAEYCQSLVLTCHCMFLKLMSVSFMFW